MRSFAESRPSQVAPSECALCRECASCKQHRLLLPPCQRCSSPPRPTEACPSSLPRPQAHHCGMGLCLVAAARLFLVASPPLCLLDAAQPRSGGHQDCLCQSGPHRRWCCQGEASKGAPPRPTSAAWPSLSRAHAPRRQRQGRRRRQASILMPSPMGRHRRPEPAWDWCAAVRRRPASAPVRTKQKGRRRR